MTTKVTNLELASQDEYDAIMAKGDAVEFDNVKLAGITLHTLLKPRENLQRPVTITNSTIISCTMSMRTTELKIFNCSLFKSNIQSGLELESGTISNTDFIDCEFSSVGMRYTVIDAVRFIDCLFRGTSFLEPEFVDVHFIDCAFVKSSINRAGNMSRLFFSGSDISGLHADQINGKDRAAHIDDAVKASRAIFTLLVASAATILLAEFSGTKIIKMPFVGVELPAKKFYLFAHFYLLGLYTYTHIYFLTVFKEISNLPAINSDSTTVESKLPLWPLLKLIPMHVKKLKSTSTGMNRLIAFFVAFSGWHILPITLLISFSNMMSANVDGIVVLGLDVWITSGVILVASIFVWLWSLIAVPLMLRHSWIRCIAKANVHFPTKHYWKMRNKVTRGRFVRQST